MNTSWKKAMDFKVNITAMGACKAGNRRDIGLIAPAKMTQGYENTLKKELCKFTSLS
jgi:hypothetical protein